MNDQLELTQMDYDKRMYDLLAANGGKEDAPELIALNRSRALEMNSQMKFDYKLEWKNLLNNGGFNRTQMSIWTVFKQISSIGCNSLRIWMKSVKKWINRYPLSTFRQVLRSWITLTT